MAFRGADEVVRALQDEGVRFAFGIPGTHNTELYDALDDSSVLPVLVTDEQSASFAADAVSRTSGTVGVANVVPGAGVTHALSGVAEAFMDGIPLVVLTCGIRTDTGKAFQLHDVDQLAILRPITKAQLRPATGADLYATVRKAFAIARAGTPGPVAVEISANLYLLTHEGEPAAYAPESMAPPAPPREAVERAAALLNAAKHPAVYAGLGAAGATEALRAVAERLSAPVCTTLQGKGVFPESHPLFLWNGFGAMAPAFVRAAMDPCDALLAVGCRFGEVATGSYGLVPPKDLIHVDIDPGVPGRNFPVAVPVAADARAFLEALLPLLQPRKDEALKSAVREGRIAVRREWLKGVGERVAPVNLFEALQRIASKDAIYTTDSGNGTFLAMEHLRLEAPGRFIGPIDYSCMGYAVPAAVGAKLAGGGRDVIALAGDGALLMTGLELMTAARYGAAPVVCVLRDGELGQIAQFQRTSLDRDTCSIIHPYAVEDFAKLVGAEFLPLATNDDVEPVLRKAFTLARAGKPVMVDVAIDYSTRTYFTKGVVTTNLWRLPMGDRVRLIARAVARHAVGKLLSPLKGK